MVTGGDDDDDDDDDDDHVWKGWVCDLMSRNIIRVLEL